VPRKKDERLTPTRAGDYAGQTWDTGPPSANPVQSDSERELGLYHGTHAQRVLA